LRQAESFGCETVNLSSGADLPDMIAEIVGEPEVDAAVDAVGFEARGHGEGADEAPATVLNDIMNVTRVGAGLASPACTSPVTPAVWTRTPRSARSGSGWDWAGQNRTTSP